MGSEIFVDTGAWLALSDIRDQYHKDALQFYRTLREQRRQLITTNLVMGEAFVLIRRAGGAQPAFRFLDAVRQSAQLLKIYSTAEREAVAEKIIRQFSDQDFSFVDAVSFAVMRERNINEVFGFDHHFLVAGFMLQPDARKRS
jgi:uncharacterized protein